MALSADIYSMVGRGVKSVADYDAEAQAAKSNKLALLLQQGQFEAMQRGLEQENALMAATRQFGNDPMANRALIAGTGNYKALQAYDKAQLEAEGKRLDQTKTRAETDKINAEADKERIAGGLRRFEAIGQIMSGVRDQATYDAAKGDLAQVLGPQAAQNMPAVYDPAAIAAARAKALPVKEQLEQEWKAKGYDLQVAQFGETVKNNERSDARIKSEGDKNRAVTMRGQTMARDTAMMGGTMQQDAQGNWIAIPNKLVPGQPVQASPVVDAATGKPVAGPPKPSTGGLGESAKKQLAGIDSLGVAIEEYKNSLKDWSKTGVLSPDARAKIGTKYNNMMLQAKEAYNLGVLNGPDYSILTTVVTDPLTMKGVVTSNKAMSDQATELDRIMQRNRTAIINAHKPQGATPPPTDDPLGLRR